MTTKSMTTRRSITTTTGLLLAALALLIAAPDLNGKENDAAFERATDSGRRANDALARCRRFVTGWLHHADPTTSLIPRNLSRDAYWNARDAAADNYPFMVLTAAITDRYLYEHRMRDMLATEIRLTSRLGPLPDDFLFATQAFRTEKPDLKSVVFGASEYVKDGLLPITEWLGPSPWADRMLALLDGIIEQARIDTPVGKLPATDHEVGGELMQSLCRAYWMTRKEQYREMAFRFADHFLLHNLPTDQNRLQLDDHGCEVIAGLSEAYYLAHHTDSARKARYTQPMHRMLDKVLETGRNSDGLMYEAVDPQTGKVIRDPLSDNWGYNYLAFLVVAELDGVDRYRQAVEDVLNNIHKYKDYQWERGGADGYADSIEGAINLLNRVPTDSAFDWVEHSIRIMLDKQRPDGVIEGWHGDGNYARTAIMYALYHTRGTTIRPWRPDVIYGASPTGDGGLAVAITADWPWRGKLLFDVPRHKAHWKMPSDYPRLNQFPQWFTPEPEAKYAVRIGDGDPITKTGRELAAGVDVSVEAKKPMRITLRATGN